MSVDANITRFAGGDFASTYDANRPTPPAIICVSEILSQLVHQKRPKVVVDVGAGTGLSTRIWYDKCDLVIGVEPNADMRAQAVEISKKLGLDEKKIKYIDGNSGSVGLENGSVDIVTVSQALHWMEPTSTFKEFHRLLRPGGVFAAFDCDWDVIINAEAEVYFYEFLDALNEGKGDAFKGVQRWKKDEHLQRIKECGLFKYTREVVVHSVENGDAQRLLGLSLSFGSCGTLLRSGMTLEQLGYPEMKKKVEQSLGTINWNWYLGYRIRLGVK